MKKLWKKFKHWCCKAGLCNLDKCNCDCHPKGRSKAYYPTAAKKIRAKTAGSKIKTKAKKMTPDGTPYSENEDGTRTYGSPRR